MNRSCDIFPKTLCWDCRKARGFCTWSEKLEPVKGWTAVPTIRKPGTKDEMRSFFIIECPEFERDAWNGGAKRMDGHEERDTEEDGNHHQKRR